MKPRIKKLGGGYFFWVTLNIFLNVDHHPDGPAITEGESGPEVDPVQGAGHLLQARHGRVRRRHRHR